MCSPLPTPSLSAHWMALDHQGCRPEPAGLRWCARPRRLSTFALASPGLAPRPQCWELVRGTPEAASASLQPRGWTVGAGFWESPLLMTPFIPHPPDLSSFGSPPRKISVPISTRWPAQEQLTLPSCRSEMEQASMKACAMTERQASMWSVFSMSKTNCGFFRMFTQNRRGRLWDRE